MEPRLLLGKETHRELVELLHVEKEFIISGAANETAKMLLLSQFHSFFSPPTLVISDNDRKAEALKHWYTFFGGEGEVLSPPPKDEEVSDFLWLQKLLLFLQGEEKTFFLSREGWEADFPSFSELLERKIILKKGDSIAFIKFIEDLLDRGYSHSEDTHLQPGEYRKTGDTLDIFPVQSSHSFRINFSFDVIEHILSVDSEDSKELHQHKGDVEIFPVTWKKSAPLKNQLPDHSLLILDDQDDIDSLKNIFTLRFTSFPETQERHVHLRYLSVLKFYTLADFLNDIRDKLNQGWKLVIVTRRTGELKEIFKEEHISFTEKNEEKSNTVVLVEAKKKELLPHSIQNPDLKCALLTDREIFSLRKSGRQRSVQKLALEFITSLSSGDYVVHMEHGVGQFNGMTQKEVGGAIREYLELSYAEEDKLFIPVDQADKLSKFVYEEGDEPKLTRLGGTEWKRVTEKMKKETEKIAKELLNLYAKRANTKGFSYQEDTQEMKKFEEDFPYQTTPGQAQAIADIKKDMEDDHPMDRLICGDVGFGKTEVAMRAAFKAVKEGKQVAVLSPITILADQHYHTFMERFKKFSTRIEMLSRFRSKKEQKIILEKLRKGDIDLIIGTHRLLQDDVRFLNLGLLIIDEEQRFGVKQKEKFKELRSSIDILTLTATPIPRTLNLSLHKLRDISTITTPPPGRLPIITEVRKYSDALVQEAICQEIKRKGQVFFLYNRVETIDAFADKLRELVPKGKFIVGHGQLKPEDLEKRIFDFKEGKFDVLVSSTIIENGIDLPRANTLIVNEAERFGLSQLYQLRGRVGRSNVQAYAYFLYHSQKLKDDAKKRLRAIVEACELGSGFQISMRDLEIRGAGEILGVEQAGTMQSVGISHYLRMLKSAMEELKAGRKGIVQEVENVEILLPIEAFIPVFYIPDEEERISIYQKLAGSEDKEMLKEFEQDIRDEYGDPPKQLQNLFGILHLKVVCRTAGVHRVKTEEKGKGQQEIILALADFVTPKEIMQILQMNPQWRISGSTLRITQTEIERAAGSSDYLEELTKEVQALKKKTKKKGVKK